MKISFSTSGIVLARGELLNLDGARGVRIVSHGGAVWITQDGDPRDIVLRDGDAFEFDRATPAIVQAFEPATLTIADPARAPRDRAGIRARRLRGASGRIAMAPA